MTFKFIRIPIDRIGALIGRSGSTKKWIEDTCKVDLSIDSKVGEVSIDSSVDSDPFKALDLIKAISFGFSKSRSSILLHEDEFLSVIDLKLYSGKSSNSLSRIKGRIIGYNGKARKVLEELTRANISVYGHYVAVGHFDRPTGDFAGFFWLSPLHDASVSVCRGCVTDGRGDRLLNRYVDPLALAGQLLMQ
mgnify:CR=1 FL=1